MLKVMMRRGISSSRLCAPIVSVFRELASRGSAKAQQFRGYNIRVYNIIPLGICRGLSVKYLARISTFYSAGRMVIFGDREDKHCFVGKGSEIDNASHGDLQAREQTHAR